MIFNNNLENIWKKKQCWDLNQRSLTKISTGADSNSINADNNSMLKLFNEKIYFCRVQTTGRYFQNAFQPPKNITRDSYNHIGAGSSYGIGLPYYVKQGQIVKIKLTTNGTESNVLVNIAEYGTDGIRIKHTNICTVRNSTVSGSYTIENNGWIVIIIAPYNSEVNIKISDISLIIE